MVRTTLTPEQRSLRARIGAFALHAQGGTSTRAGTDAFLSRFVREVEQAATERGECLTPEEAQRRATLARRGYFARLALASSRARSKKPSTVNETLAEGSIGGVGRGDNPTQASSPRLVETTGVRHLDRCGERVRSPHSDCQAAVEPYRAAERYVRPIGTFIVCRCGTSWREVPAA